MYIPSASAYSFNPITAGYSGGAGARGRVAEGGVAEGVEPGRQSPAVGVAPGGEAAGGRTGGARSETASAGGEREEPRSATAQRGVDGEPLSEEQQAQLRELKQRDREVRAHEAAHVAAGAGLVTSGASFSYERGPDGALYAVGGEVSIDTSPVSGDPEATLRKAEQIRAAALAPAEPSGQDRSVAAQATQMAAQARTELAQQQLEGSEGQGQGQDRNAPGRADERIDAYRRHQPAAGAAPAGTGFAAFA